MWSLGLPVFLHCLAFTLYVCCVSHTKKCCAVLLHAAKLLTTKTEISLLAVAFPKNYSSLITLTFWHPGWVAERLFHVDSTRSVDCPFLFWPEASQSIDSVGLWQLLVAETFAYAHLLARRGLASMIFLPEVLFQLLETMMGLVFDLLCLHCLSLISERRRVSVFFSCAFTERKPFEAGVEDSWCWNKIRVPELCEALVSRWLCRTASGNSLWDSPHKILWSS